MNDKGRPAIVLMIERIRSPARSTGKLAASSISPFQPGEQFMFRSSTGVAIAALALSACSGLAPRDPDLTPINPTAVLEMHMVNAGTADFPGFETTTLTYTRANMQRSESSSKGDGAISRFLDGDTTVRIERLDRKLAWTLDAKSKRAIECPLKGCPAPIPRKPPATKTEDDKSRDPECRLKSKATTVTVEPTGQKRSINGFDAEQYDIKWLATFRDNASRQSTSTISIDLWTTPATPQLTDATAFERAFAGKRDQILDIDGDTDRAMVLPAEVGRMINSYLSPHVSPTDRASFLAGAKKLDKVKGQTILMTVKWRLAGEACSMNEAMKDIGDKPLFTFTSEVKTKKLAPLHDSLFAPPKEYKLTK
jgi:hypothetical protein